MVDDASQGNALSFKDRPADITKRATEVKNEQVCAGSSWKHNMLKALVTCPRQCTPKLGNSRLPNPRYFEVVQRYLETGDAIGGSKPRRNAEGIRWHLPHQAVINPKKLKYLRVVLECATIVGSERLDKHVTRT